MKNCKENYFSHFGLSFHSAEFLSLIIIVILAIIINILFKPEDYFVLIFLIIICMPFVIAAFYSRKMTLFEQKNTVIKHYGHQIF